ncbi:protease inhibitor I42 family protein [Methanocalculus taiwanensis]|uniref:Protease inhibitor I42 family protein n=1 Tax=Methanocalculus taiwanensis TaxID=106207 RepID=A0ABD4THM0_9EURY|nr:protease inhibitor I42 family protein [Methanocalculus taiwanensis]MCQ1537782.1 protease inhibitor I42 family protein [Methanocalculus taiwanensis]
MIRNALLILLIATALLVTAGCVAEEPEAPPETPAPPVSLHMFDATNNGESYTFWTGEFIQIKLVENPTTGYSWDMAVPEGLTLKRDEFIAPETEMAGAPGMHVWEFEAGAPGTYTVEGKYVRPWETDAEPAETFTLTIIVEADAAPAPVSRVLEVDETNNGGMIGFDPGMQFKITLVENPTTGYSWDMAVPEGLTLVSDEFIAPDTELMGAPGTHVWLIQGDKPGEYVVEGKYIRPWEADGEPADTFTLEVMVG